MATVSQQCLHLIVTGVCMTNVKMVNISYIVMYICNPPVEMCNIWEVFEDTKSKSVIRRKTDNTITKRKRTNNDLQNTTHKTKDRATRIPLITGCERRCSGRLGSYISTSGTSRFTPVPNPDISREWGKDREKLTTSGTYPWSFVTQILRNS